MKPEYLILTLALLIAGCGTLNATNIEQPTTCDSCHFENVVALGGLCINEEDTP